MTIWKRQGDTRIAELEAACRKYQAAVALCLGEGGSFSAGDDTPWWTAIIEAQQDGAAALRKST